MQLTHKWQHLILPQHQESTPVFWPSLPSLLSLLFSHFKRQTAVQSPNFILCTKSEPFKCFFYLQLFLPKCTLIFSINVYMWACVSTKHMLWRVEVREQLMGTSSLIPPRRPWGSSSGLSSGSHLARVISLNPDVHVSLVRICPEMPSRLKNLLCPSLPLCCRHRSLAPQRSLQPLLACGPHSHGELLSFLQNKQQLSQLCLSPVSQPASLCWLTGRALLRSLRLSLSEQSFLCLDKLLSYHVLKNILCPSMVSWHYQSISGGFTVCFSY